MEIFRKLLLFLLFWLGFIHSASIITASEINSLGDDNDIHAISNKRTKRNLLDFGMLIQCATKSTCLLGIPIIALDYNGYGCYCGSGPKIKEGYTIDPLDGIDECCRIHDECYGRAMHENSCTWLKNPKVIGYKWSNKECDQGVIECQDDIGTCNRIVCECDKKAAVCFTEHPYDEDYMPSQMKKKKKKLCVEYKKSYVSGDSEQVTPKVDCSVYGNMLELSVSGASMKTAQQDNLRQVGESASHKMVTSDLAALKENKTWFYKIGHKEGIHPALLGAIASRVSRGGKLLDKNGMSVLSNNADEYGLMQCNMKTSGLNCRKYGPFSEEHIEMMVTKALIPYIKQVQQKFPKWKPEKQLQGGIAVYNFGIDNVRTKDKIDVGTTGNDFSNDVIARAQGLERLHNWKCDDILEEKEENHLAKPSNVIDCDYYLKNQKCQFYYHCVEKELNRKGLSCWQTNFHLMFLHKHCVNLKAQRKDFTEEGQEWLDATNMCLMSKMMSFARNPSISCQKLNAFVIQILPTCYHESGVGFCNIIYENKVDLLQSALCDIFGKGDGKQEIRSKMLQILQKCSYGTFACEAVADASVKAVRFFVNGAVAGKVTKSLIKLFKKQYPKLVPNNSKMTTFLVGLATGKIFDKFIFDPVASFLRKGCRTFFKHYKDRKRRAIDYQSLIKNEWESAFKSGHVELPVTSNKATDAQCITYAEEGDCRFYECFEEKFPCSDHSSYHILHLELPHCQNMERQGKLEAKVKMWHSHYQKCLMSNLLHIYQQSQCDCNTIEEIIAANRTQCVVDAGWCGFENNQLWYIYRGLKNYGYPAVLTTEFLTLPVSKRSLRLEDHYFSYSHSLKEQFGDANFGCFIKGERASPYMYQQVPTGSGAKVIITE